MIKLLIVEDDPLMFRMYQKIFTLEGYTVEIANDGQEGLDRARMGNPTLILLDIMMPKMNGLQTLELLKADPITQKIPVIILTNIAGEQDIELALNKGAEAYIVKSESDPSEVTAKVKEILAKYSGGTNPAQDKPST